MKRTVWLSIGFLGVGMLAWGLLASPRDSANPGEAVNSAPPVPEDGSFKGRDVAVRYDETLRAETRDEGWARDKELTLAAAFAELGKMSGIELSVIDLECRSSLCKTTLAHHSKSEAQRFLEYRSSVKELRGSGFVYFGEDTLSLYLAREGTRLPTH